MSGFWGAEVEGLRQQGQACGNAAGSVETLLGSCAELIDGVEWIGPDAESFRERWGGEVRPLIEQMIEMLRADDHELARHADAQEEASAGGDGGGASQPRTPIPSFPLPFPLPTGIPPVLPKINLPLPMPGDDFAWPITPPWGKPPEPTVPDSPFTRDSLPFPFPPLPKFEIPRCPVPRIDPDDLIIGIPPLMTDCFPTPAPLPPLFPPPMTDCWPKAEPLPLPEPLLIPESWPKTQPLPLPEPLPIPESWPKTQPLPLPEPLPIPENWPLPQPLPQPLPIPDQWPMPLPLPRPDVYRF